MTTRPLRTLVLVTLLIFPWDSGSLALAAEPVSRACHPAADASRIAIAGGSVTEVIYGLDEESRILAVDRTSNFPPEALTLPQVGYVRNLSAEGILSLEPTLIIGEDDMGPIEVVDQLQATGIEIRKLEEVHTAQGVVDKVTCIASIIGLNTDEIRTAREALAPVLDQLANVQHETPPRVALLLNLSGGVPMAGGAETSATGVLEMAGATNVFAGFNGWKPVSLEAMAEADPKYIVMPLRGLQGAGGLEGVLAHPAVKLTRAGQQGNVISIDGMTLLGFGPRTLQAAVDLAGRFGQLP